MDAAQVTQFLLVCGIFFAAGLVKGVLGMGLPTVAMGLLGLVMPVLQAAALLTVPSLATNVWQAVAGGGLGRLVARLWTLQAGVVVGMAIAALTFPPGDQVARMLLGGCLLAYGLSGFAGWRPPTLAPHVQRIAGPVVGLLTGMLTAMTGVFVLPAVPYLQSLQLDRKELAQALGLSFTVSALALAVLLVSRGQLNVATSLQSGLVLVPACAGMWAGQKLRDVMSEPLFRRCFFGGLVVLGGWLLAR